MLLWLSICVISIVNGCDESLSDDGIIITTTCSRHIIEPLDVTLDGMCNGISALSGEVCSGHGICDNPLLLDGGLCKCFIEYIGVNCEEKLFTTCEPNGVDTPWGCSCSHGWRGRHCNEKYIPEYTYDYMDQNLCGNNTDIACLIGRYSLKELVEGVELPYYRNVLMKGNNKYTVSTISTLGSDGSWNDDKRREKKKEWKRQEEKKKEIIARERHKERRLNQMTEFMWKVYKTRGIITRYFEDTHTEQSPIPRAILHLTIMVGGTTRFMRHLIDEASEFGEDFMERLTNDVVRTAFRIGERIMESALGKEDYTEGAYDFFKQDPNFLTGEEFYYNDRNNGQSDSSNDCNNRRNSCYTDGSSAGGEGYGGSDGEGGSDEYNSQATSSINSGDLVIKETGTEGYHSPMILRITEGDEVYGSGIMREYDDGSTLYQFDSSEPTMLMRFDLSGVPDQDRSMYTIHANNPIKTISLYAMGDVFLLATEISRIKPRSPVDNIMINVYIILGVGGVCMCFIVCLVIIVCCVVRFKQMKKYQHKKCKIGIELPTQPRERKTIRRRYRDKDTHQTKVPSRKRRNIERRNR